MLGLETAISIVQKTMVDNGLLTWQGVAERMSHSPARIGGYEHQGQKISVGSVANVTLINPLKSWTVDRDLVQSRSRNTPFHGYVLPGVVTHTFYKGKLTLENGVNV